MPVVQTEALWFSHTLHPSPLPFAFLLRVGNVFAWPLWAFLFVPPLGTPGVGVGVRIVNKTTPVSAFLDTARVIL